MMEVLGLIFGIPLDIILWTFVKGVNMGCSENSHEIYADRTIVYTNSDQYFFTLSQIKIDLHQRF